MTPLLSVLIPTRNRLAGTERAVDSFLRLAAHRSNVEFLLRVDEDDTTPYADARLPQTRIYYGPRGRGYGDIGKFYAELGDQAQGEWVIIFNDDAEMLTAAWDSVLANARHSNPQKLTELNPRMFNGQMKYKVGSFDYPIHSLALFRAMKNLRYATHIDTYSHSIAQALGLCQPIGIDLLHAEPADALRAEVLKSYEVCNIPEHRSTQMLTWINQDLARVAGMLGVSVEPLTNI